VLNLVTIGLAIASLHNGEVGYHYFFSLIWLSVTRTADAEGSTPTFTISIDAVWPKHVPFGGFNTKHFYLGVIPENPLFGAGIGISNLNVGSDNLRTTRPILVICS
jgi:hypothetical protein